MIRQRVRSGMANAKEKGKVLGRPHLTVDSIPDKFWKYKPLHDAGETSVTEMARLLECSRGSVYKYLDMTKYLLL